MGWTRVAIVAIGSLATACSSGSQAPADAAVPTDVPMDMGAVSDAFLGCSPGELLEPTFFNGDICQGPRCVCPDYAPDGGTLVYVNTVTESTSVISYQLPQPMKAGQPYVFSLNHSNSNFTGDLQLWGTDSSCGPGLEMLWTEPVTSKIFCVTMHPTADHSYILFVTHHTGKGDASSAASNTTGQTACPTATCP